ncbi:hypothetical protein [Piscinibacter koreensis]|uniref:DUF4124 domain-containing protein n=1 Tax=Piscinibacter koreensis TaxID=2742824 RepID=A0A7Y6TX17_9BURK|nr:hypothetical protein [Schlegelella koreensis]NUZ06663.1 hypothetical protein [Schlegelella koreensis]
MKAAASVLLALLAGGAAAQTLYRCGNAYSEVACPGAQVVGRAEPQGTAHAADARREIERTRRLADDMERDRLRREASIRPALAGSLSGPPKRAVEPAPPSQRPAKKRRPKAAPDEQRDFIAAVPGSGRKR